MNFHSQLPNQLIISCNYCQLNHFELQKYNFFSAMKLTIVIPCQ